MTYNPNELNCSYCGTPLTGQEIEFIQKGTAVRCRGCGSILTNQSFADADRSLSAPSIVPQQPMQHAYRPPQKRGTGGIVFFLGFVVLSLGLYSWFFPIPIFSSTYYGEIFGAIATIIGLSNLRKEAPNPSGVNIMIIGLVVWVVAWISWWIEIPILSSGFIGEASGLALIIYGYIKSNR